MMGIAGILYAITILINVMPAVLYFGRRVRRKTLESGQDYDRRV